MSDVIGEVPATEPTEQQAKEDGKQLEIAFGDSYVDQELKRWVEAAKDEDAKEYRTLVASNVKELNDLLNKQGHSGESWRFVLKVLRRVADNLPLTPLTGEEDEWGPAVKYGEKEWQSNKRCHSVMRDPGKNETAHYLYAYAVSDNGGRSWYVGNWAAKKFGYPTEIKFPYSVPSEPTRIYIKYDKEVPAGVMDHDAAIDITGNEEEIKKLYDEWTKKMK